MCSGSPGDNAWVIFCIVVWKLELPAWPNHVVAVAGNMMIEDAKIGGSTPHKLGLRGKNRGRVLYTRRPPLPGAEVTVTPRRPPSADTPQKLPSHTTRARGRPD